MTDKRRGWKVTCRLAISCIMVWVLTAVPILTANAVTIYESDWTYHKEGYIFVGESHVYEGLNGHVY